ncbi:Pyrroline-5-carboxylate reductase 3 [Halotydeus destructor]|nr:Pyrroline-5-carboxylate reductase 3 [Halotydeus destructor]
MSEDNLKHLKIGFIGAGNMAFAMFKGLIGKGAIKPDQVTISAPSANNTPKFTEMGAHSTHSNDDLLPGGSSACDIIFLCVKPHQLGSYLKRKEPFISYTSGQVVVVSILAGVRLEEVRRSVNGPNSKVYRIMTNTACTIGAASCAIVKEPLSNTESDKLVLDLTSSFGQSCFLSESLIDAYSGVSGCGIAFGYTFIQAMADGAVKMGIPRKDALRFAAQTIDGACKMVLETQRHPIVLRDEVCSAGGATIVGVHALEKNAVSSGIIDAVEASTLRCKELS